MKIRELFVKLGVQADSDELDKFDNALEDAKDSIGNLLSIAGKAAGVLAGMFGGMAALSAVHGEFAEEAVRTAAAFRMTTDSYQELRFAFQSLNASSDDLHDVLQSTQTAVYRAGLGATTYKDAIEALGLSYEQLAGRTPDDTFYQIVDAARAARDAGEDVSGALQSFFGDDLSRRILPGIMSATGSFEQFRRMAKVSGLVIEEDLLEKAADAQLQFRSFGATMTGLSRIAGIRLAPAFGRLADHIMTAVAVFSRHFEKAFMLLSDKLASEFEKMSIYFSNLNNTIQTFAGGWGNVFGAIIAGLTVVGAIMTGSSILGALAAIKMLIVALSALIGGPIIAGLLVMGAKALAIVAIIATIVLFVEDLIGYFNGVDSVTGRFIDKLKTASSATRKGLGKAIEVIVKFLKSTFTFLAATFGFLVETLKETGAVLLEAFKPFVGVIGGVIIAALILIAGTIGVIILAVVTLLKIFNAFVKAIIFARDMLVELSFAFTDGMMSAFAGMIKGFGIIKKVIAELFSDAYETITNIMGAIDEMIDKLKNLDPRKALSRIGGGIGRAAGGARAALGRVVGGGRSQSTQNNQSVDASNMRVEVNVANSTEAPDAVGEAVASNLQERVFGTFLASQYAVGG